MREFLLSPIKFVTIYFVLITIHFSEENFNFFLSTVEVQKLLGLEAELYYVRQGTVNNNALNFVVSVPSKINVLHFSWESLDSKPLPYSIEIYESDKNALDTRKINISDTGLVPMKTQVFSLTLHCTGTISAEVDIEISINVTTHSSNTVLLKLRRKKICTKLETSTSSQSVNAIPIRKNSARIFYYAIICAAILAATSTTCIAGLYVRNHKHQRNVEDTVVNQSYTSFLPPAIRNPTSTSYNSFRRMPSYSLIEERPSPKSLQERLSELTIQRCRVCLRNIVLEGTFARVYQGKYASEEGTEEEVLIKTVADHASQVQISLLLQEGMFMYALKHPNILSILGVSFEDNSPPFLLYPLHNYTNLKVFLQKCKMCSEGVAHTLTTQEVVDMALQVIEAMNYLHKRHILHKDLATRNCAVDSRLKIQITDNALARDLFPSDYHCLGDNENRPIKWLALESLINKTFSTRSDVWSFGVVLWELTTLAQQPYIEIDPFEIAPYLKDGYRLAQPINCPDELFAVMAYCWAMNPQERPSFLQLQVCLKEFYMQLTRYV